MAESDGQERSEEATEKRLREAREKGQLPRSRELGTVLTLLIAAAMFIGMGQSLLAVLADTMVKNFSVSRADIFDSGHLPGRFLDAIVDALLGFAPFFLAILVVAVASTIVLGGWNFSTKALAFKFDKFNLVKGLGRLFSWRGLVEMLKSLAKFMLIASSALLILNLQGDHFLSLGSEPLPLGMADMADLLTWSFLIMSSTLIIVALIDVPFQLWDHARQMKMTKQEIKEEHKQSEGSPESKGRQRQVQMDMAQQRMMAEVPKADVIITNPTHYAVALRYDQEASAVPLVVAKGSDMIAMNIRTIAREHEVPVLEAAPLARAIYHSTEIGEPIPEGLYRAVAQVLAYVYHLRQGPIYNSSGIDPLQDLPIPDDLRHDE